jgi:hypothetical protein
MSVAWRTARRFGRTHRSLSSRERSGIADDAPHHGRLHEQRE